MRIGIIGRSEILYDTTLALKNRGHEIVFIITSKEAPEYTKTSTDFRAFAENYGIPFLYTAKIAEKSDWLQKLQPFDIGVSLNYNGIIPKSIIDLFPLGILNAHGGDLPRYRGNACQAWAILNGEERIGLCIHRMIGGELDSGDILGRDYFYITLKTKITEVYQWMNKKIPYLFEEVLDRLEKNPDYCLEHQSLNPKDALRCYPRRPEDGHIDWNKSALDILRIINASNKPYSGAFCEFEGDKMIVWDAEIAPEENFLAIPGQITAIGNGFIEVATGKGKLRITEIEWQKEKKSPDTLIKSIRQRLT